MTMAELSRVSPSQHPVKVASVFRGHGGGKQGRALIFTLDWE